MVKAAFLIGHTDGKGKVKDRGADSPIMNITENPWYNKFVGLIKYSGDVFHHDSNLRGYTNRQESVAKLTRDYDVVFELHFNSSGVDRDGDGFGDGKGCEAVHNEYNSEGKEYAVKFCKLMHEEFKIDIRRKNGSLGILRNKRDEDGNLARGHGFIFSQVPTAVILEPFFGDNDEDCALILKHPSKLFTHVLPKLVGKPPMNNVIRMARLIIG